MQLLVLIVGVAVLLVLGHARLTGRRLQTVEFRFLGLVPAAVIPQLLAFYVPATRIWLPDLLAPVILVWSQLVLLGFVLLNVRRPGMLFLGLGLAMNFVVILANGGMMPLTPQTASRLSSIDLWAAGARFGPGKSVVVPTQTTLFGSLSDRIMLPDWFPYQAAFSLGDILIVAGAIALLWAMTHGKAVQRGSEEQIETPQGPGRITLTAGVLRPVPDYGPQQVGG
jgi:hypothetical protein